MQGLDNREMKEDESEIEIVNIGIYPIYPQYTSYGQKQECIIHTGISNSVRQREPRERK